MKNKYYVESLDHFVAMNTGIPISRGPFVCPLQLSGKRWQSMFENKKSTVGGHLNSLTYNSQCNIFVNMTGYSVISISSTKYTACRSFM